MFKKLHNYLCIFFFFFSYPEETMQLVAELSEDIATDYRERQKSKLKRTFVKASDAATSKVQSKFYYLILQYFFKVNC